MICRWCVSLQPFADGFTPIRESAQWIRTHSRKCTMHSHGFAKVCKYTPIRTDSRKFTKVRNRFTLICGWIRKDSRKFTYGFAPIHKDSHPIIQSNHGGIRELADLATGTATSVLTLVEPCTPPCIFAKRRPTSPLIQSLSC